MDYSDLELSADGDLLMRVMRAEDAPLIVEATSAEEARSLWGAHPVGPYSLADAEAALEEWTAAGQMSVGILREHRLLGAVGLMPDRPGSLELAYWVRPEERGKGIATTVVRAATQWAHDTLGASRVWLEIRPGNEPSLRLAERGGYHFEQLLREHCRDWECEDPALDSRHDCLIWSHAPAAGQ